jgi:D-specific alpha-keto acid dehydrogenase
LNDVRGKELRDLTVGVIGTGRIGAAVMDRLRGFGCRVLTYDRRPRGVGQHLPLDELLRHSDVVSLHTALTDETRHLLDHRRIQHLKHGAVVVNTGRGALIDTEALVSALESGSLGGAALDVVEGEEGLFYTDARSRSLDSTPLLRLRAMPHVIISPHTAYYTDHALRDMVESSLANCLRYDGRYARG